MMAEGNKRFLDSTYLGVDNSLHSAKRLKSSGDNNCTGSSTRYETQPKFSCDDYSIGWICALPIEMAAAEAMLSNKHESPSTHTDDTNTYTFGSIGSHNIAIACLPSGHYGTNNAATVANNMQRSFPSIQLRLMVGIGGGVPGKVDVRLGDVVVGDQVVQYDFGKAVGDGRFLRTGIPCRPPQHVMTTVSKLRARHEQYPSQISTILADMVLRNPRMSSYARSSRLDDFLFNSGYDHLGSMEDCRDCDRSKSLKRAPRSNNDPGIHYGLIASGNQVIKHGKTRDKVAQDQTAPNSGILCFEMEAAGLTGHFPCLVVRGICDYSDSHKNKQWQRYAAAVAAAYVKELLDVIPAVDSQKFSMPVGAAAGKYSTSTPSQVSVSFLHHFQNNTHYKSIEKQCWTLSDSNRSTLGTPI